MDADAFNLFFVVCFSFLARVFAIRATSSVVVVVAARTRFYFVVFGRLRVLLFHGLVIVDVSLPLVKRLTDRHTSSSGSDDIQDVDCDVKPCTYITTIATCIINETEQDRDMVHIKVHSMAQLFRRPTRSEVRNTFYVSGKITIFYDF